MHDYVREHSFGSIFRSSFGIYFANFIVIFVVYMLPLIPLGWVTIAANLFGEVEVGIIASFLNVPISILVAAAIMVAVSDVCLGNRPRIGRSYRRLAQIIGSLLGTWLLQIVIVLVGFILLFIPGVMASIYLMFALTVVVLERMAGFAAIKRSYQLVKGRFWRNFGVIFVIALFVIFTQGLVSALLILLVGASGGDEGLVLVAAPIIYVFSIVLTPLIAIAMVLLYYDCRVRKEHFDSDGLAQELMQ